MDPYEEQLTGGNMGAVVRVGDTVRRVTGEWTPAVHRLLETLAGIDEVPRVLGIDERGREILSFVPGEVLVDAGVDVLWSDHMLTAAAQLLRRIHDASVELVDDHALVWRSPSHEPAEVICHNDFATYNLITCDGHLAGVIDFDFASPGPRLWDLAYLAYRIVPFAEDAPDADGLDRRRRLAQLIEAYGMEFAVADVRRVAAERLEELRVFTLRRADETGREDFLEHAAMYARDAARLRSAS